MLNLLVRHLFTLTSLTPISVHTALNKLKENTRSPNIADFFILYFSGTRREKTNGFSRSYGSKQTINYKKKEAVSVLYV